MNTVFDCEKIHNEVEDYLGGYSKDYDIPAIMNELMKYVTEDCGCISSIDDVDPDDFTEMLKEHEK